MLLTLRIQPRASRNQLVVQGPERILLRLTAPPVEGAANAACCAFLADRLDLPRSRITILRGETARWKQFLIREAISAEVLARLQIR